MIRMITAIIMLVMEVIARTEVNADTGAGNCGKTGHSDGYDDDSMNNERGGHGDDVENKDDDAAKDHTLDGHDTHDIYVVADG